MTNTQKIVGAILNGFARQYVDAGEPLQPHVLQMATEYIEHEYPEISGSVEATRVLLLEQRVDELERRFSDTRAGILLKAP